MDANPPDIVIPKYPAILFIFAFTLSGAYNFYLYMEDTLLLREIKAKHLKIQLFEHVDKVSCPRTKNAAEDEAQTWDPMI